MDVASVVPVPAFCSSDEESDSGTGAGGEAGSLLYLPIAPDVEEPEDHFVPGVDGVGEGGAVGAGGDGPTAGGSGSAKKGDQGAKENASPAKRKRTKTTDVALPNAPKDGNNISLPFNLL